MGHDHGIVGQHERLERATAALDPPLAVRRPRRVRRQRRATWCAARPASRSGVASKSVRCRALLRARARAPGLPGRAGLHAARGAVAGRAEVDDVVVALPDGRPRRAARSSPATRSARAHVTLMVDSAEHLDFIDAVLGTPHPELRVCLDLDASLRLLAPAGARRRAALAGPRARPGRPRWPQAIVARPGFRLVGLMAYEAQIAGVGDAQPGQPLRDAAVRPMQRASAGRAAERRAAAVAAVSAVAPLEFVNGGGTGSVRAHRGRAGGHRARRRLGAATRRRCSTPTARSRPRPAALFALPVVRRPGARRRRPCSAAATPPRARPARTGCPCRSTRPGCGS